LKHFTLLYLAGIKKGRLKTAPKLESIGEKDNTAMIILLDVQNTILIKVIIN